MSLDSELREELAKLEHQGRLRKLPEENELKRRFDFTSNDYLGLSRAGDPS